MRIENIPMASNAKTPDTESIPATPEDATSAENTEKATALLNNPQSYEDIAQAVLMLADKDGNFPFDFVEYKSQNVKFPAANIARNIRERGYNAASSVSDSRVQRAAGIMQVKSKIEEVNSRK